MQGERDTEPSCFFRYSIQVVDEILEGCATLSGRSAGRWDWIAWFNEKELTRWLELPVECLTVSGWRNEHANWVT